jgi:Protein of unknown function (DUF2919)
MLIVILPRYRPRSIPNGPPTAMPHSYAPSNYDEDFCLKPPLLLWLVVAYLSRAVLLPVAVGIAHVAGVNAAVATVLRGLWSVEQLLPSLIVLPVLYSLLRRVSTAPDAVRWVWHRGRYFLAVAAVVDAVLPFLAQGRSEDVGDALPLWAAAAAIDVYCLLYVLAAKRVRDTFASFPPAAAANGHHGR